MIQFFKDAALTRPAMEAAPKWFLVPEEGGERTTSLWLGDAYYVTVVEDAAVGATTVKLDQTVEIPASGMLSNDDISVTYTAKDASSITVAPLATQINAGTRLKANTTYTTAGNLMVFSHGNQQVQIALKAESDTEFGLPTVPYIFSQALNQPVVRIDLKLTCRPGTTAEFSDIWLEVSGIQNSDLGLEDRVATARIVVSRRNQDLQQQLRVLAPGRELQTTFPGFVFGEYRWRDRDEINAESVVPTRWDADVIKIGPEKFTAGIGHADDLQLVDLVKSGTSINPRMRGGHYFTGHLGYYLPATPMLEFVNALGTPTTLVDLAGNESTFVPSLEYVLEKTPKAQKPVFVGRWRVDQYGYYDKVSEYRYVGRRYSKDYEFDPGDSGFQYVLDRKSRTLKLNKGLPMETIFVGIGTDDAEVTFDMPVHPVAGIGSVYCDSYDAQGNLVRYEVTDFTFNKEQGTLRVGQPTDEGQIWRGNPIFAECIPALAILYDTETEPAENSRSVAEIDLNPAFAGISKGNFYLMHRRWKPRSLQLFADKPRIPMPASLNSLENCVAFGPVFYEKDYAALLVKAYGNSEKDLVPNVRLRVVADEGFQGYVNYLNPLTDAVEMVTGGDGSAGLIYLPNKGYGVYLDLTASTENGDTLVLPEEVPYAQIFNALDGWLTKLYIVRNDDPYLGKVGADTTKGELPWLTLGTPGTTSFQTNGRRTMLKDAAGQPLTPSQVYDSAGRTPIEQGFTGVKKLKFAAALPTGEYIGAFFLSYLGRVTLKVVSDEYGLESNSILLQLSAPEEIVEATPTQVMVPNISGYLILDDDFNGILNINRLAGGALLDINNFNTRM